MHETIGQWKGDWGSISSSMRHRSNDFSYCFENQNDSPLPEFMHQVDYFTGITKASQQAKYPMTTRLSMHVVLLQKISTSYLRMNET